MRTEGMEPNDLKPLGDNSSLFGYDSIVDTGCHSGRPGKKGSPPTAQKYADKSGRSKTMEMLI